MPENVRNDLIGAMIGLARTCFGASPTDQTEGLLLGGLYLLEQNADDERLKEWAGKVRQDKAAVSPNCVTCTARCGKNDDYDMSKLDGQSKAVREIKLDILASLQTLAAKGIGGQLMFDSLFCLAEDWEPEDFQWYRDTLHQKIEEERT